MASRTRRFTPSQATGFMWLVLIGDDGAEEKEVWASIPDETFVRRLLSIPETTPILIGRP